MAREDRVYRGKKIDNIRRFLSSYRSDELIIRTTFISGGWHDIESDVNRAGFNIRRDWLDNLKGFNEVYIITRR